MLTWEEADGAKTVGARLGAKGYQDPDLRSGNVDIAGCATRGSSHLQSISLPALKKRPIWSLEIKKAFLQAGGPDREEFRVWRLRAPAYGLNDDPVASHRSLRKYLLDSAESLSSVGIRFAVSSSGPRLCYISRQ